MYERLCRRCLTECTGKASHHMNVYIVVVWVFHWAVWCGLSVIDRAFVKWPEHRLLWLRCFAASSFHPGRYLCGTSSRPRPLPSQCCPFHCSPTLLPKKAMPDTHSVVQKMGRGIPVIARKPNMISVVWDVRPFSLLYGNLRFEENCCFPRQGRSAGVVE
jgi:hypothetical protein